MSTTLLVTLELNGEPSDALHVVDTILDGGCFQDAINDWAVDNEHPDVHVKSAYVRLQVAP